MTSTTIKTKRLAALNKLAEKDGIRYYNNGVYIDTEKQKAVVSNSLILLSIPVEVDPHAESFIVKKTHTETQVKVAKATKAEVVEVSDETETISGQFPKYESAFPREEKFAVSFSLENLKKMIDALSVGAERKDSKVKLTFESNDRPIKVECEDMTGLIVPTREP